jgi:ABC-2 type transport system ATP-binding protein
MTLNFGPRTAGSVTMTGVARSFGDRRVLDGVDLHLGSGEVAMILGENGSGKTTLLRILAGVLDVDAGEVALAGSSPGTGMSSFVPSGDRMLNWRLTGSRNLTFFARLAGLPEATIPERLADTAGLLDAQDLLERPVGQCSMGQRRRLMLAVGFLSSAPVVVLDEPDADLDDPGRAAVDRVCRSWAEAGGVVVYATPNAGSGPAAQVRRALRDGVLREIA